MELIFLLKDMLYVWEEVWRADEEAKRYRNSIHNITHMGSCSGPIRRPSSTHLCRPVWSLQGNWEQNCLDPSWVSQRGHMDVLSHEIGSSPLSRWTINVCIFVFPGNHPKAWDIWTNNRPERTADNSITWSLAAYSVCRSHGCTSFDGLVCRELLETLFLYFISSVLSQLQISCDLARRDASGETRRSEKSI